MVSTLERADYLPTPPPPRRRSWWPAGATAASAALFWFGTGLHPDPWLTWLAPLPVLALAARGSARRAAAAGFVAWLLGGLNLWSYYVTDVELPVPVVAGFLVLQALVFAAVVLLFRALLRRDLRLLAAFAPAAALAGAEYLISLVSPAGAFTSLGYTQTDFRTLLQLVSATGVWGITFVLLAVPALVVVIAISPHRRRLAIAAVVMLALVFSYGAWRRVSVEPGPPIGVGLLAAAQSEDGLPWDSPEAHRVLATYLDALYTVSNQGATYVVLPEKVFRVDESQLAEVAQALRPVTVSPYLLTVVIGLTLRDGTGVHNVAIAFSAGDSVRYDKQHLIPGLEDHFTAGDRNVLLPGTAFGLTVCKDLDYPQLVRSYAADGARTLLVPALDFDRDGWLHSRIAVTRGVESGVAVARAAGRGALIGSDATGRILGANGLVVVPAGPGGTPYDRVGDLFAWLCLALVAGSVLRLIALSRWSRRRRGSGPQWTD